MITLRFGTGGLVSTWRFGTGGGLGENGGEEVVEQSQLSGAGKWAASVEYNIFITTQYNFLMTSFVFFLFSYLIGNETLANSLLIMGYSS